MYISADTARDAHMKLKLGAWTAPPAVVGVGVGSSSADSAVWLGAADLVIEVSIWLGAWGIGREPVGCSVSMTRPVLLVARSSSTADKGSPKLTFELLEWVETLVSIRMFFWILVADSECDVVVAGGWVSGSDTGWGWDWGCDWVSCWDWGSSTSRQRTATRLPFWPRLRRDSESVETSPHEAWMKPWARCTESLQAALQALPPVKSLGVHASRGVSYAWTQLDGNDLSPMDSKSANLRDPAEAVPAMRRKDSWSHRRVDCPVIVNVVGCVYQRLKRIVPSKKRIFDSYRRVLLKLNYKTGWMLSWLKL